MQSQLANKSINKDIYKLSPICSMEIPETVNNIASITTTPIEIRNANIQFFFR